jgi:hypothetical protein
MRWLLATAILGLLAAPADACKVGDPVPHEVDPLAAATDQEPPGTPVVDAVDVRRGVGHGRLWPLQQVTSCDDLGAVLIDVRAEDDQTPAESLGWRREIVAGVPPEHLFAVDYDYRGETDLHWPDGATNEQEPLSFTVRLFAIDRAGNVSEPVDVRVSDPPEDGGCRIGGRGGRPGTLFTVLVAGSWLLVSGFGARGGRSRSGTRN